MTASQALYFFRYVKGIAKQIKPWLKRGCRQRSVFKTLLFWFERGALVLAILKITFRAYSMGNGYAVYQMNKGKMYEAQRRQMIGALVAMNATPLGGHQADTQSNLCLRGLDILTISLYKCGPCRVVGMGYWLAETTTDGNVYTSGFIDNNRSADHGTDNGSGNSTHFQCATTIRNSDAATDVSSALVQR